MTTLYQYLKNTGILLSLTDAQGTIIDFIGDNVTLSDITEHTNLYLGAMRDEKHAGTTGIGLCLVTKSPTQIQGAEHYCQTFHNYIGTAHQSAIVAVKLLVFSVPLPPLNRPTRITFWP